MGLEKRQLEQERQSVIKGLAKWEEIIRGSLMKYHLTCGNKGCQCYRGKKHGPYWYVAVNFGKGKQKAYKINKEEIRLVQEGIKCYEQLWKGLCRIAELNIEILRLRRK
jgi:hypothetical protein